MTRITLLVEQKSILMRPGETPFSLTEQRKLFTELINAFSPQVLERSLSSFRRNSLVSSSARGMFLVGAGTKHLGTTKLQALTLFKKHLEAFVQLFITHISSLWLFWGFVWIKEVKPQPFFQYFPQFVVSRFKKSSYVRVYLYSILTITVLGYLRFIRLHHFLIPYLNNSCTHETKHYCNYN